MAALELLESSREADCLLEWPELVEQILSQQGLVRLLFWLFGFDLFDGQILQLPLYLSIDFLLHFLLESVS